MMDPKCELVRMVTADELELQGLLFEPDGSSGAKTALIHVHGWAGNFYENLFIDDLARKAVNEGVAFLAALNRGAGIVSDIISMKGAKRGYERIGGCIEKFEDSVLDIRAAIDFLAARGYGNIILEGHSLGCQKVAYYMYKTKDERVRGLVFLAPVDDASYVKRRLLERYDESIDVAKRMVRDGEGSDAVPSWMAFYPLLTAKRFLDLSDPKTMHGRMFYYGGGLDEIRRVVCPCLAVFGSRDDYEAEPEKKLVIIKKAMKRCDTVLVDDADHWFFGHEDEMAKTVFMWIGKKAAP
ncbi:MAG: alpha/beta fold hydrolase [archaeon]